METVEHETVEFGCRVEVRYI